VGVKNDSANFRIFLAFSVQNQTYLVRNQLNKRFPWEHPRKTLKENGKNDE